MAKSDVVQLHEVVKEIAAGLVLENGRMLMTDENLARHRGRLGELKSAEDKKAVLGSLVAFASRLMREGKEAASQPILRLMDLAAELIGDPTAARTIFENAGMKPDPKTKK